MSHRPAVSSFVSVSSRALRAAAAVTGVIRRGAAAGALIVAGCSAPAARPAPANVAEAGPSPDVDAGVAPDARVCAHGEAWSACCQAAQAAGEMPRSCQAWGPPAPPVFVDEVLA